MQVIDRINRALIGIAILAPALPGTFFCAWGVFGYFTRDPEWWLNGMLGLAMVGLSGAFALIPIVQADARKHRQESEEAYRAALRLGFTQWAQSHNLTVTEADAITVVNQQLECVAQSTSSMRFR